MITISNALNRVDPTGQTDVPQNPNNGGFISQAWGYVKSNAGVIVGGLVGGPVGSLVGSFVQGAVNNCNRANAAAQARGISFEPVGGLNNLEQHVLEQWIDEQLIPASQVLINRLDDVLSQPVNANTVNVVNDVLKQLAVASAYAKVLTQYGERTSINTITRSAQYVADKVEILETAINTVEKSILEVAKTKLQDFKVVIEPIKASAISNIETLKLDWQGKSAQAQVKKYIPVNQQTTTNQTVVTVTNTDPNNGEPSTTGNTTPIVDGSNTSWLKIGLSFAAGFVVVKKLFK